MAEMLLEFYVKDQTLVRKKDGQIPRKDSEGYLFLKFNFIGQTWENLNIIPWIGYQDESKQAWSVKSDTVVDLNRYQVPVEYLGQNYFLVSLSGTGSDGFKISTNVVKVSLAEASSEIIDLPNLPEDSGGQSIVDLISTAISMGNQIIYAETSDGISYITSKSNTMPTIATGSNGTHKGKGTQIVFIPDGQNTVTLPTLKIGNGEAIQIRLRAPQTQNNDDHIPDATLPVPVGALMRGVPYMLTFCGKYWLVDSMIGGVGGCQCEPGPQFDSASAEKLRSVANNFIGLSSSSIVGVPVSYPEYGITNAEILRASDEAHQQIKLVSSGKVEEMIRKDITADYAAWSPESGMEKTVENYAKTLPDGKYYIIHGGTVYMDIFTVYGDVKYRFIRRYEDDSCYIELFRGDELTICVEDGASSMMIYGSKMLMDWNIPLPTAADVGKVLMASTVNRAAWTAVKNAEEVAV